MNTKLLFSSWVFGIPMIQISILSQNWLYFFLFVIGFSSSLGNHAKNDLRILWFDRIYMGSCTVILGIRSWYISEYITSWYLAILLFYSLAKLTKNDNFHLLVHASAFIGNSLLAIRDR